MVKIVHEDDVKVPGVMQVVLNDKIHCDWTCITLVIDLISPKPKPFKMYCIHLIKSKHT